MLSRLGFPFAHVSERLGSTHSRKPPSVLVGYHESNPIIIDDDHSWKGYVDLFVGETNGNYLLTLQLFDSLREAETYIDEMELQS